MNPIKRRCGGRPSHCCQPVRSPSTATKKCALVFSVSSFLYDISDHGSGNDKRSIANTCGMSASVIGSMVVMLHRTSADARTLASVSQPSQSRLDAIVPSRFRPDDSPASHSDQMKRPGLGSSAARPSRPDRSPPPPPTSLSPALPHHPTSPRLRRQPPPTSDSLSHTSPTLHDRARLVSQQSLHLHREATPSPQYPPCARQSMADRSAPAPALWQTPTRSARP